MPQIVGACVWPSDAGGDLLEAIVESKDRIVLAQLALNKFQPFLLNKQDLAHKES